MDKFNVSVSPHIRAKESTVKIMWSVNLVLLPLAVWGVLMFGLPAFITLLVATLSAVITEGIINLILKKNTIFDGSAVLTGLLVGLNMPPTVPFFVPLVASIVGIGVFKWAFGGLGTNIVNPAIGGRVFVFFSWSSYMSYFSVPSLLKNATTFVASATPQTDTTAMATPLTVAKLNAQTYLGEGFSSFDVLSQMGYKFSSYDIQITDFFRRLFNVDFNYGYFDAFVGIKPGSIGEISIILILIGAIFLLARKIITWHIPVTMIGSFAVMVWIFGGLRYGTGFFTGDVLFEILTGGLFLGAFFMATDMVTSPITKSGALIYGTCIGLLTFLIRFYGSFPEGVSLAILFMNLFVPMINKFCYSRRFGFVNKKRGVK